MANRAILLALLLCVAVLLLATSSHARSTKKSKSKIDRFGRKKKEKAPPKPKQPPVVLNIEAVPSLDEIVSEAGLQDYIPKIVRMGIIDTRLLLRMTSMDYRMMQMEWEDVDPEKITLLKEIVGKYFDIAKESAITTAGPVTNKDRDKLLYGRMVVPGSVQSFEFAAASFGGKIPRGRHMMQVDEAVYGCPPGFDDDDEGAEAAAAAAAASFGNKGSLARATNRESSVLGGAGDEADVEQDGDGDGVQSISVEAAEVAAEALEQHRALLMKHHERMEKIRVEEEKLTVGATMARDIDLHKAQGLDLSSHVFAVQRGRCSFLRKAMYAASRNATGTFLYIFGFLITTTPTLKLRTIRRP